VIEAGKPAASGDSGESDPVKIPFRIDDGLVVRSLTGATRVASCRIVGASYGQFILITEPAVKINDRLSAVLDDNILCNYFCEGYLYTFRSAYRNLLMNDIVSIAYPAEVEVRQIRKDRRIKVNIETKIAVDGSEELFLADMKDISRGGCCLVFSPQVPLEQESRLRLTFSLPNEALIKDIRATAVRINRIKQSNMFEAGLSFSDQDSETCKVADFCEFCNYFDLD